MRRSIALPLERTAALFIDMQEEHRSDERLLAVGYDRVLANAARLQAACRAAGVSLFHFAYVVDRQPRQCVPSIRACPTDAQPSPTRTIR